jgi:hypothetical protein
MDILDYNLDCAFQDWDFDCLSEMESTVTENAVSATFTYEYQMAGRLTGDVFDADWTQRITKCESKSATACAMFEDILEIPVVPCAWAQKVQGTRD